MDKILTMDYSQLAQAKAEKKFEKYPDDSAAGRDGLTFANNLQDIRMLAYIDAINDEAVPLFKLLNTVMTTMAMWAVGETIEQEDQYCKDRAAISKSISEAMENFVKLQ